MTHKEEMEYLRKHDPITYYELTGNPTGSDSQFSCADLLILLAVVTAVALFIFFC